MNTRLETAPILTTSSAVASPVARALRAVISTRGGLTSTALRLTLGLVMFPHGAQKLLGWFGGGGFNGTLAGLTQHAGLPAPIAVLVILIEFFGSLALIAGVLSRPAALGIAAVMVGAIAKVHLPNGFFMNWSGAQAGEGFEYHLLAIGIALALMVAGGGSFSIDRALSRRFDPVRSGR